MTRYRVPRRSMIVAAPGTQALIQILPRLLPPSRVAIVGPTYEEHQSSWSRAGHEIHIVPTLEDSDVVVVVNPNNPSGRLFSHQELAKIAGFLVIDEAFIDFLPRELSAAGRLPGRVVVLRSFGKTYGLAGLRLGVAIARPDIATRIREELGPWAVSGPALEIGRRALADDAWLSAARERLLADGARLDELLRTAGFASVGATPLFRLARHDDVPAVVERLGRQGIHVRAFSRQPQWLRFGLPGTDEAFRRLAGAL